MLRKRAAAIIKLHRTLQVFLLLLLSPFALGSEENTSTALWGRVEVVEELRIGSFDGAEEYLFGAISYLAVGLDGSIYVADRQLHSLRQFDSKGVFLRNIGQKGEGPGEYLFILGMTVLPNGKLAIYDPRNQRVTLFQASGEYLSEFRFQNGFATSGMLKHDNDGKLYVHSSIPDSTKNSQERFMVLTKLSAEGQVLEQVPMPYDPRDTGGMTLITDEGPQYGFFTTSLMAWSPLGYWVTGHNADYSLEVLSPGSDPIQVHKPFDPIAVHLQEKAEWQAWAAYFRASSLKAGLPPSPVSSIPKWKPAFKALGVGEDGTIWVQRYVKGEKRDVPPREPGDERPLLDWREPQMFDAFSSEGTFLGSVKIPRNTKILVRRRRHLWGVATDDLGEHIVRFRIDSRSPTLERKR